MAESLGNGGVPFIRLLPESHQMPDNLEFGSKKVSLPNAYLGLVPMGVLEKSAS